MESNESIILPLATPDEKKGNKTHNQLSSDKKTPLSAWAVSPKNINLSMAIDGKLPSIARKIPDSSIMSGFTSGPIDSFPFLNIPEEFQESILVDDLLLALIGHHGRYILATPKSVGLGLVFTADKSIPHSHKELVERILPIASKYTAINQFLTQHSKYTYGLVSHAFCAAVKFLIKDYLVLINQLEVKAKTAYIDNNENATPNTTTPLRLSEIWYYVQPSLSALTLLEQLVSALDSPDIRGGAFINILYSHASLLSGDKNMKDIFAFLLNLTTAPYFSMLSSWVYEGKIDDPYSEFMVSQSEDARKENLSQDYNNAYWEQRFTLRLDQVPSFLTRVQDSILTTGKYLNVIRETKSGSLLSIRKELTYSLNESDYVESVQEALSVASKALLDLLMTEAGLVERLYSIKHYFLLDQGDFLVHFMDIAKDELIKPVAEIQEPRLQSLLELAVRTSVAVRDPYHDDLACKLLPFTLINQLLKIIHVDSSSSSSFDKKEKKETGQAVTGLDAFTFNYKVDWPLSLILNKKALTKYQLIFRHLFHCKHVERQLCNSWMDHKATKGFSVRSSLSSSYALRQRMLHFLQNLENYMMSEVLEPEHHRFMNRLASASTVDQVLDFHEDFLNTCLKRCMLTNPKLLKVLTKLMSTCVIFSDYSERFTRSLLVDSEALALAEADSNLSSPPSTAAEKRSKAATRVKVSSEHVRQVIADKGYTRTIAKFEHNFGLHLKLLLDSLNSFAYSESDPHLLTLTARLDFNDYYSTSLSTTTTSSNFK